MAISIVKQSISLERLHEMAERQFGNLVKAVVDVEQKIMAIGGELHADEETILVDQGSKQENLWGINLYPTKSIDAEFIEFDSMINLRPLHGNYSRGVEDIGIQEKIRTIVRTLITK